MFLGGVAVVVFELFFFLKYFLGGDEVCWAFFV